MMRIHTSFLKSVIVLLGIAAIAVLVRFPQVEGRATGLGLVEIYSDPFIIYIYIASTPFFVALTQAHKFLEFMEANKTFTSKAIKTIRNIRYCALTTTGFLFLAILYIRFFVHGDDPTGPTMLGIFAIFGSVAVAVTASLYEKLIQKK